MKSFIYWEKIITGSYSNPYTVYLKLNLHKFIKTFYTFKLLPIYTFKKYLPDYN